jgi:AcrR family transcriptional regulator
LAKLSNISEVIDLQAPETPPNPIGSGRRFNAILDAAEVVFASSGFNGASIREIANKAGVAQALIHYHFDNKEKLYEATTARRASQINSTRAVLLDGIFSDQSLPTLEMLVEALFRPNIETGHELAGDGSNFSRILVSGANSHEKRDQRLVERYYDPIATRFIKAFSEVEPDLSRKNATWAYLFSIGIGLTMMAQTGRSLKLSKGACDDSDIEAMLSEIVVFVCGGIRAMIVEEFSDDQTKN